jgi:hypothetical protein
MDLHHAIVSAMDFSWATKVEDKTLLRVIRECSDLSWRSDLESAFRFLKHANESTRSVVNSWLAGVRIPLSTLKPLGIMRRIESIEDSITIISALFRLLNTIKGTSSVALMIDEFQQAGELARRKLTEVSIFLQKLFDANPEGLQMFLAFTTGEKETAEQLLGNALFNRVSNNLELPEFDDKEALQFLQELLMLHTIDGSPSKIFSEDALKEIVKCVSAGKTHLIPRDIIKAADRVLRAADPEIEDGDLSKIDDAFVRQILVV